jgi:hypothetical protein
VLAGNVFCLALKMVEISSNKLMGRCFGGKLGLVIDFQKRMRTFVARFENPGLSSQEKNLNI